MRRLLTNRNFVLLWSGQLISAIGTALHDLAIAWFIYELTGSTLATGASIVSSFLPRALLSPVAGMVADRYNRKWLIVFSDVLSGLSVMSMYCFARQDLLTLPVILGFTALLSASSAFIGPASSAAIQSILDKDDYQSANSLRQLRWRFSTVIGAFLGGVLLRLLGIRSLLLINALSFWLSALAESFIALPTHPVMTETDPSPSCEKTGFGQVIHFLLQNRPLLFVLVFVMVMANGLFMCLFVYMPALFSDVLAATSAEMGTYYALEALTATITAAVLLGHRLRNPYRWVVAMLVVEGAVLLSHGLIRTPGGAYLLAALLGVSTTICVVAVMTVEQLLVPNRMMGRFSGIAAVLGDGSMPVFTLLYGFLGLYLPIQTILLFTGVLFLIMLLPAPWMLSSQLSLVSRD